MIVHSILIAIRGRCSILRHGRPVAGQLGHAGTRDHVHVIFSQITMEQTFNLLELAGQN